MGFRAIPLAPTATSQISNFQPVCCKNIFLKHATPDCLVRGTDLFSRRGSNKKMTTANTTVAVQCEWLNIIAIFFVRLTKIYILVCYRILVISLRVPRGGKGSISLPYIVYIMLPVTTGAVKTQTAEAVRGSLGTSSVWSKCRVPSIRLFFGYRSALCQQGARPGSLAFLHPVRTGWRH